MCLAAEDHRYELPISKMPSPADQARIKRALRRLSFRIDRVSFQAGGPGKERKIRINYSGIADPNAAQAARDEIRNTIDRFL